MKKNMVTKQFYHLRCQTVIWFRNINAKNMLLRRASLVILFIIFGANFSTCKKCVKFKHDPDGPSLVYAEALTQADGIGQNLNVFAMLWLMRRNFNVDAYIGKRTYMELARVFDESTLDIPVLDDHFCDPDKISFEYYSGPFNILANRKDYRTGRTLWLWPSTEALNEIVKNDAKFKKEIGPNAKAEVNGGDHDNKFRGYKIVDHQYDNVHDKFRKDYQRWMKRKLAFQPAIANAVQDTLETIARKMDLKPKDVTYVGIHNRRSKDYVEFARSTWKQKPLKKSYFNDAMDEFRDSYDNVAFMYVSDDMKWGRKNLKDRENDLYFVGRGGGDKEDNDAFDFALLASCNHTIMTRGAFTEWVASFAGGEFYTEYGSIVPNEVNDVIEEEAAIQRRREEKPEVYATKGGDVEGLLFPDIKLEGSDQKSADENDESSSWFW